MAYDIQHMKVGDKVLCKVHPTLSNHPVIECTVTYIHPKHYFFEVEYEINGHKLRESYCPFGPQDS